MPPPVIVIPMLVAGVIIITLRLGLARASRERMALGSKRSGIRVYALVPVLIPLVMIAIAALAGAFSALDTPLGLALAPLTLGIGITLGWFLGPVSSGPTSRGSQQGDRYSFWILAALITLRIGVRLTALGSSPHSLMGTVSSDLMLVSVGMAVTRLATMLRRGGDRGRSSRSAEISDTREPSDQTA